MLIAFAIPASGADVTMPAEIAVFVCKTVEAGPPDQNAEFTKSENRAWAIEDGKMQCRREKVTFGGMSCAQASIVAGAEWNNANRGGSYRAWLVACPTPTINSITREVIAWDLPACPHRDIVVCDNDVAI